MPIAEPEACFPGTDRKKEKKKITDPFPSRTGQGEVVTIKGKKGRSKPTSTGAGTSEARTRSKAGALGILLSESTESERHDVSSWCRLDSRAHPFDGGRKRPRSNSDRD